METLSLDEIRLDNAYLRLETNVDELVKSIENVGLIHPLVVNSDNKLLAGGRRYCALKKLGYTQVPVTRVDKNDLQEELISIDENLVRKDLNNMQFEANLKRAKDIYEDLNPFAAKSLEEEEFNEEEESKKSFVQITAEKSGLTPGMIKNAIMRDEMASEKIKKARSHGELTAANTNEVIKLTKKEQEEVLPMIMGKPSKEVKQIVKDVRAFGVEKAIENSMVREQTPREIKILLDCLRKTQKIASKINLEGLEYQGEKTHELSELTRKTVQELMDIENMLGQSGSDYDSNESRESYS